MKVNQDAVVYRGAGRDQSISVARFVAMVMIILCHMFSYYKSELALWLNVGVQVFFVISGFLYGTKEINNPIEFIKRRFGKILIPYWLFLLIAIVAYLFICPQALSFYVIVRAVFCSGTIDGLGHLWFVGYILLCYLITPYLYWLRIYAMNLSSTRTILYYAGFFVAIQLIGYLFDSYFEPDKIGCFVSGFFLADIFRRFSVKIAICLKWMIIILAILMNGIEVIIKYFTDISFIGWQDIVFRALCRYSHLFLGIAIFLLFYGRCRDWNYNHVLRFSDQYSYPVYLVHQLFILSPMTLMSVCSIKVINWIIVLFSIFVCSFILYHISKWVGSRISFLRRRVFSL